MSLLRKKAWWQKLLYSRLALLLLFISIVALSFAVFDRWRIEREVSERRAEKEAELVEAETKKQILEKKVENIRNEDGVESEIRKHFDVAREGEQVVVLVGKNDQEEMAPKPEIMIKERSWWTWFIPWLW